MFPNATHIRNLLEGTVHQLRVIVDQHLVLADLLQAEAVTGLQPVEGGGHGASAVFARVGLCGFHYVAWRVELDVECVGWFLSRGQVNEGY